MNASDNVLYKYSGSVADVTIPNTVTVIAKDAFASMGSISTVTLPDKITDIRENAFSGVKNISKDITVTGKTEQAKNKAKELANQYTHLVYKDSGTSKDSDSSVVTTAETGSIKLGAAISGSAGSAGSAGTAKQTGAAASPDTTSKGTITLGAGGTSTAATTGVQQPSAGTQPVVVSPFAPVVQPAAEAQPAPASQPETTRQSAPASQPETARQPASASQSASATQPAAVTQNKTTPVRQSASSGSSTVKKTMTGAPKGTQHIKDSTPKTGDHLQYRMLIVCAMFSVGVLLILTGNGKKKKFSAS